MTVAAARRIAWSLILIQGGHVAEHLTQAGQVYLLGLPRPHAHGLLGALFDFEWVHFAYNTVFLAALIAAFRLRGRAVREKARGPVWSMFVAGLALQSYHQVEHIVKIVQHVVFGAAPAPGILGHAVDLVFLHLAFNALVYAAVLPLLIQAARSRSRPSRDETEPIALAGGGVPSGLND